MSTRAVKTPHAAVIIWNYNDRLGREDTGTAADATDDVNQRIISTLSCSQIQTSKGKSQPNGTFSFVMAPYANWVESITPGSWCAILMSNTPISKDDITSANRLQVKMVGKIESVRVDVNMDDGGARHTTYNVSGTDWGHIFQSMLYIDNLLAAENDPRSQGNAAAVAIRNALFGNNGGSPKSFAVRENLASIMNIFGQNLDGFDDAGRAINRLAKAIYDFRMPQQMVDFFKFTDPRGNISRDRRVNKILKLQTGRLVGNDKYNEDPEASGFIDPFSLQGTNTFWQILLENSNPAMNEMFCEMKWDKDPSVIGSPSLVLYNRIKPFSFKESDFDKPRSLTSMFQDLRTHLIEDKGDIDPVEVISINAGTNWRDKFNFIEIKPQFQDFVVIANWVKQKSQIADPGAFQREGFRPLIVGTKQFPFDGKKDPLDVHVDMSQLSLWAQTLREWYFDTHRMLNGTIVLHGVDEYIAVGENIRFPAGLINTTPNMNASTVKKGANEFVLAHIENVSHSFAQIDGARTYTTTIQFVRGIIVDGDNVISGRGTLDQFAASVGIGDSRNRTNVISTSDENDPDKLKKQGT